MEPQILIFMFSELFCIDFDIITRIYFFKVAPIFLHMVPMFIFQGPYMSKYKHVL